MTPARMLEVEKIRPNPDQPRKHFAATELQELADDLKARGVLLQAIGVRPARGWDGFDIIWGERRWRAAGLAGWAEIPAVVLEVSDADQEELAIVENLHRKDLRLGEESDAFAKLLARYDGDETRLLATLKKPEPYVRQRLALQNLSRVCRIALDAGGLTLRQGVDLAKLSKAAQDVAFKKIESMTGKGWRRMVHAMAAAEDQPALFAVKEATPEEKRVLAKYDAMLERLEHLVRTSFKKDEVVILAKVLDARVVERARRMAMIASHLNLLRKALNRAHARVQAQEARPVRKAS